MPLTEILQDICLFLIVICGIANTLAIRSVKRRVSRLERPDPPILVDLDAIRADIAKRKAENA